MNAKYFNAIPLYRLEQEFKRAEVNISRQVMANWVISVKPLVDAFFAWVKNQISIKCLKSPKHEKG